MYIIFVPQDCLLFCKITNKLCRTFYQNASFPALLQISCLCSYKRLITPTFCCTYL